MRVNAESAAEQPKLQQNHIASHPAQLSTVPRTVFEDLRPETVQLRAMQAHIANSERQQAFMAMQANVDDSPRARSTPILQARTDAVESPAPDIGQAVASAPAPETPRPNSTGLPDQLRAGIESLSGLSLGHVKVHYNSDQPAQMQAYAYAQGSEIHVASGQERHLPHEAWHVVQQAQGRVKPTMQLKGGLPVNDDAGLETEADVMGARALSISHRAAVPQAQHLAPYPLAPSVSSRAIQRIAADALIAQCPGLAQAASDIFSGMAGWGDAELVQLATGYLPILGNRDPAVWAAIGAEVVNRPDVVIAFARMDGWNAGNLTDLARLFAPFGPALLPLWTGLAGVLVNREPDVSSIAQIVGWNSVNLLALANLFAPVIGADVRTWADVATLLIDREADVSAIARIPGWSRLNLVALTNLFNASAVVRPAVAWAAIAAGAPALVDHEANVSRLVQIPLARDQAYLVLLAAGVETLSPLRTIDNIVNLAQPAVQLAAADIVTMLQAAPVGMAITLIEADILSIVNGAPTLDGTQYVQLASALHPSLDAARSIRLIELLRADGVSGPQIHATILPLQTAGENGVQIETRISAMRGDLGVGSAAITTNAGTKVLSGTMIHEQVTRVLPAGPLASLDNYPTGHIPAARAENDLWEDVRLGVALPHLVGGADDTLPERAIRQRLALRRLMTLGGVNGVTVQQVFQHHEGAYPRAADTVAVEDTASGGHIDSRHVLGTPGISTLTDLALRVLRHVPSTCPGVAGAFTTAGDAQPGMQAGMDARYGGAAPAGGAPPAADWVADRGIFIRGAPVENDIVVAGINGQIMTIALGGAPYNAAGGGKMQVTGLPAYYPYPTSQGGRPYWVGDGSFAAAIVPHTATIAPLLPARVSRILNTPPFNPLEPATGLVNLNVAPTGVHLRMISRTSNGGWAIHSAWPI
jgi:hypothetical protein